jgi:hypothetical protein
MTLVTLVEGIAKPIEEALVCGVGGMAATLMPR